MNKYDISFPFINICLLYSKKKSLCFRSEHCVSSDSVGDNVAGRDKCNPSESHGFARRDAEAVVMLCRVL
jgi:hypothetical protein